MRKKKQLQDCESAISLDVGPSSIWPRGYKTSFLLNSAEHGMFSASKYENAFYIY